MTDTEHYKDRRNWTEDKGHENGEYMGVCGDCGHEFIGHKRRVRCRTCMGSESVWIELQRGDTREEMELAAHALNQLLGILEASLTVIVVDEKRRGLLYASLQADGSYSVWADDGTWFHLPSLTRLARKKVRAVDAPPLPPDKLLEG